MTVKERVNQFIAHKGIRINAFESSIGVSKSYWSNTQKISAEVVADILRVYSDLSAEWLMRGVGEMIKNENANETIHESAKYNAEVQIGEDGYLKIKIKDFISK